jgi:hypothetical protein
VRLAQHIGLDDRRFEAGRAIEPCRGILPLAAIVLRVSTSIPSLPQLPLFPRDAVFSTLLHVALTSRTTPREPDRIREVFLSATAMDLEVPRTEVREALRLVLVNVVLQEEWAQAASNALTLSLARLADTDAYLGIFGYRYGWIPPGQSRSVTELECEEALNRWGKETVPPIFWFLPEPGSAAAEELEKAAEAILAKDFPHDAARRAESCEKQKAFCERLRGSSRFVTPFSTVQVLRERAIAGVANWNAEILKRAAAGPRAVVRDIPPSELGAIGRDAQREVVEAVWLAVEDADQPGVCLAVHGREDSGQFAFLSFLEQWNPWNISGTPHAITPSFDAFDVRSLTAAALGDIAPGHTQPSATIEALAAAILDRSETEPVVMFLPHLSRLAGTLEALHGQFWQPLTAAARARRATLATPRYPFVLVVVVPTPLTDPLPAFAATLDPEVGPIDVERIILLPELRPFTSGHIMKWLESVGVSNLRDRKRIAGRTIGDGTPRGVFDRLNSEGFWPALAR